MKKLFSNKRFLISLTIIIVVVSFSIFQWFRAIGFDKEVVALCDVSDEPCVSRLSLYILPSIKIFLFSGIVFSSAFLLLSALKNKD
jgi:hypothetical protein